MHGVEGVRVPAAEGRPQHLKHLAVERLGSGDVALRLRWRRGRGLTEGERG